MTINPDINSSNFDTNTGEKFVGMIDGVKVTQAQLDAHNSSSGVTINGRKASIVANSSTISSVDELTNNNNSTEAKESTPFSRIAGIALTAIGALSSLLACFSLTTTHNFTLVIAGVTLTPIHALIAGVALTVIGLALIYKSYPETQSQFGDIQFYQEQLRLLQKENNDLKIVAQIADPLLKSPNIYVEEPDARKNRLKLTGELAKMGFATPVRNDFQLTADKIRNKSKHPNINSSDNNNTSTNNSITSTVTSITSTSTDTKSSTSSSLHSVNLEGDDSKNNTNTETKSSEGEDTNATNGGPKGTRNKNRKSPNRNNNKSLKKQQYKAVQGNNGKDLSSSTDSIGQDEIADQPKPVVNNNTNNNNNEQKRQEV